LSSLIHATYRVKADAELAARLARFIAYEQTVELPEALVTDRYVLDNVVGRVEHIEPDPIDPNAHQRVRISYQSHLASRQLSQLLNLVFGNVSLLPKVRLVDLELPPDLLTAFPGPRYGIDGVRALLGVYGRPLLATAVKPRGLSIERLAQLAHDFALGGGDIVKDDQNLVDDDFESFKTRVDRIASAVERANARSGRNCLYFPHISAPAHDYKRFLSFVQARGLRGVLMCPMVLGLDVARAAAERFDLIYMAHPSLTGAFTEGEEHGISHAVLLGTLFRLSGADISIFPGVGGRFELTQETCQSVASALTQPLGHYPAAFPCPAGGMNFQSLPDLSRDYGQDAVFLIGGALLGHGPDLSASTAAFQQRIAERFAPENRPPQPSFGRKPPTDDTLLEQVLSHLKFDDWQWAGRHTRLYKDDETLRFKGIKRVELLGKFGEQTAFDLRYFEVEPGGFSSREKHLHTHAIIVARGGGEIEINGQRTALAAQDIVYVAPLEVHQLHATGHEPLGFYCIVDHQRDRPMAP
jgi:ribulose-bisphosphate carboxylase large chain